MNVLIATHEFAEIAHIGEQFKTQPAGAFDQDC